MKIILNPDLDIVEIAKEQLKETNGMCPCVLPNYRTPDKKCMCATFRKQVEKGIETECPCGLYISITE